MAATNKRGGLSLPKAPDNWMTVFKSWLQIDFMLGSFFRHTASSLGGTPIKTGSDMCLVLIKRFLDGWEELKVLMLLSELTAKSKISASIATETGIAGFCDNTTRDAVTVLIIHLHIGV